jgi:hypothetical protein
VIESLTILNGYYYIYIGTPCEDKCPPPSAQASPWSPFENRAHFELAEFLYKQNQMSAGNIDKLMEIWASLHPNDGGPFDSHNGLYKKIDSIEDGDDPWDSFTIYHPDYQPEVDDTSATSTSSSDSDDLPAWKRKGYDVWFRDPKTILQAQLSNPQFKDGIDYTPKVVYNKKNERVWENFMSGNWAWEQCVS